MSTPPPVVPPPRSRFGLSRRSLLLIGTAFVVGLVLFLLVFAGRRDEGFFRAGQPTQAQDGGFEALPTPEVDEPGDALPSAADVDEGDSISGTGEAADGTIAPPDLAQTLPPPPTAPQAMPPAASGASTSASPLRAPQPQYPPQALRRGERGTVLLQVEVDAEGRPARVDVVQSSRSRALDREAVRTVERWTFNPATRGGQPVATRVLVPIVFNP